MYYCIDQLIIIQEFDDLEMSETSNWNIYAKKAVVTH
jgi:hypothetical protein